MKHKILSIIFIISLLIGCSSISLSRQPYVDPVLRPAYDAWVGECIERGIKYKREISKIDSILYIPLEEGYWGRCYGDKITISSKAISPIDEFTLKLVMFHELGHGAFDYDHYEYSIDIMNSVLLENDIPLYHYFFDIFLVDDYFHRYISKKDRRRLQKH
jgi:hypothetical protein